MDFERKDHYKINDLIQIVEILRDPVNGCPWDRVQTHESVRMNFLEETYEVLEAIDLKNAVLLKEELGDVLLQVALHSRMEQQSGGFGFDDVCDGICQKLISRHPHIFGQACVPGDAAAVLNTWDALKNKEKGRATAKDELESVPATLPALMKAAKLQKRASRYGYGSCELALALETVKQQAEQMQTQPSPQAMGQLLFAAVQAARAAGIDPEHALQDAYREFSAAVVHGEQQKAE